MEKVFLLGNPRSGTSLLRIMLNCHPKIAAPPECGFLQWWFDKYKNWSKDDLKTKRLDRYIEDLFSSKKIETWCLEREVARNFLVNEQPISYGELSLKIYELWGLTKGIKPEVIIDKNNYYIHHLNEISQIWPDARFILVIRDGRDVACSYKDLEDLKTKSPYKPDLPTDIEEIAKEWKANHQKIVSFFHQKCPFELMTVKYESLVMESRKTLNEVCRCLNLEFSLDMLNYHIENQRKGMEPEETLDWKKKTLRKPDSSNVGKYKKELTNRDIKIFNKVAGDMLKQFNYSV